MIISYLPTAGVFIAGTLMILKSSVPATVLVIIALHSKRLFLLYMRLLLGGQVLIPGHGPDFRMV